MPEYTTPVSATRQELAKALTAPDPAAYVETQLKKLDALEAWISVEKDKWEHVQALVGLPPGSEVTQTTPSSDGSSGREPAVEVASGKDDKRPTRREAATAILSSEPRRAWKLSEIVAEFDARGWGGNGEYEDHLVLRTLTDMLKRGQVKRPKKGYYKIVPTQAEVGRQEGRGP